MMNKKVIFGFLISFAIVVSVIAIGLHYGLRRQNDTNDDTLEIDVSREEASSQDLGCCQRLEIKGTTNQDEFYQEMMGLYVIYPDYPHLDFTKITEVKHDLAKHKFPVYTHNMYNGSKSAFLYYFYNTEPQLDEQECPEGCWILSMYEMTPGNHWYGKKWYYIKKAAGKMPSLCPDDLTADRRFTNQEGNQDQGLKIQCLDS